MSEWVCCTVYCHFAFIAFEISNYFPSCFVFVVAYRSKFAFPFSYSFFFLYKYFLIFIYMFIETLMISFFFLNINFFFILIFIVKSIFVVLFFLLIFLFLIKLYTHRNPIQKKTLNQHTEEKKTYNSKWTLSLRLFFLIIT